MTVPGAAFDHAGVREYWLSDARGDAIAFEILSNDDGRFRSTADAHSPQPSDVLGGRWTLTRARNRAGRFSYDLART